MYCFNTLQFIVMRNIYTKVLLWFLDFEQMNPVKERCALFDKNGEEKKQMLSAIHNTPMMKLVKIS